MSTAIVSAHPERPVQDRIGNCRRVRLLRIGLIVIVAGPKYKRLDISIRQAVNIAYEPHTRTNMMMRKLTIVTGTALFLLAATLLITETKVGFAADQGQSVGAQANDPAASTLP